MPEAIVEKAAFWAALMLIETAIPMIVPNRAWAGGSMLLLAFLFLAAAYGWLPAISQALAWKHSLAAFVLIGASLGACAWSAVRKFVPSNEFLTSPVAERSSTDPDLYGTMATSIQSKETGTLVVLNVTVQNRGGSPSIATNWQLDWACGTKKGLILNAPMYPITKDDLASQGIAITELSTKSGISPGGEAHYKLVYGLPCSIQECRENELRLALTFYDVRNRSFTIRDL